LFALYCSYYLPETLKQDSIIAINLHNIGQGYLTKLKNGALIKASLCMGLATTFSYLFASIAPFIAIKTLKMSPEQYGLYSCIPPLGMIAGFYLTQYLHGKKSAFEQIKLGISLATVFSLLGLGLQTYISHNPLYLFLPVPAIYTGISLVFVNTSALSIGSCNNKSNGSAMTNFLNMLLCTVILLIVESTSFSSSYFLFSLFIILSLAMWGLWQALRKDPHFS
jgi:hypothetical protein